MTWESVSFRYDPGRPLVEDLTLDVAPGQSVAIVGPTGAGKTTLVNLLLRFYDVQGGRILLDGVDIRDLPRRELRRRCGAVLQDGWLLRGTIRDNIAFGCPEADDDRVAAAARAAGADHFVATLLEGYATVVGEGGSTLSAGERQLLALARAFLVDPAVLVLDEATSDVDPYTELRIRRGIRSLRRGRTTFVITHRLATAQDADLVLVMDHGAVVERGTHEELLGRRGLYHALWRGAEEIPPGYASRSRPTSSTGAEWVSAPTAR